MWVEGGDENIGCIILKIFHFSSRLLVSQARRLAVNYKIKYGEPIPTVQLVKQIAEIMQEYTQSG